MKMEVIYLVPGLGADERLFDKLKLPWRCEVLKWQTPEVGETVPQYAQRLSGQIDTTRKFGLLGVSFGGMLATELSRILHPEQLVLISTVKTKDEMPPWLRFEPALRIINKFEGKTLQKIAANSMRFIGEMNRPEREQMKQMIADCDPWVFKWSLWAAAHWENTVAEKAFHIHGTLDYVFPYSRIQNAVPLQNGGHFMVLHRANEVANIIAERFG